MLLSVCVLLLLCVCGGGVLLSVCVLLLLFVCGGGVLLSVCVLLLLCVMEAEQRFTHCFSCASRSLTSASRLFTSITSSSSSSCSRLFWASVFCQSVAIKHTGEESGQRGEEPRTTVTDCGS